MSNANQFRHNGRFARKNIVSWKENVSKAVKRLHAESKDSNVQLPKGRRVVDFNKLAEEMWCHNCDLPLHFRFLVQEDICGLASVFHFKCPKCERIRLVKSSTSDGQSTKSKYHVNFKLALAILDGGIGETQLNTILSTLNIPTINHNLIKRYERLVGPAIETVAKESCHEALKIERELTIANEGYCDETTVEELSHVDQANVKETGYLNVETDSTSININKSTDSTNNNNIRNNLVATACGVDMNIVENLDNSIEETDVLVDPNNNIMKTSLEGDISSSADSKFEEIRKDPDQGPLQSRKRKSHNIENAVRSKKRKVGLRLSYDGAWLKKGSGKCYNSKQGHGTAFGHYSRKCVAYATRNKGCRYCRIKSKKIHDCRSNYVGSSKAMEADIAVQILTNNETFTEENVEIKTLIGDEDSSTIANLRRASGHSIDKWTDINHATRKVSNFLHGVKKIPKAAVEYLLYCFNSALRANEGNVESTKAALLNIVPHAFGEHNSCDSWCNYHQDPENFKHKYLPGGKPLAGDGLKASILPIFKQAADNAEKLAPRGSSQINENCNAVITTKAPKAKHYSDSSSSDFRVAAGISQVNLGTTYMTKVNSVLGLSPMKAKSLSFRVQRDTRRKKRNAFIKTPEFKKKRRVLFRSGRRLNTSAEAREGISYQSNSEIGASLDLDEKNFSCSAPAVNDATQLVIFDLETTGIRLKDQIVQIAAQCGDQKYNAYITPSCYFSADASEITGLTLKNGQLLKNSVILKTVSPKHAISGLITFLESVSSSVMLAAHNGMRFDVPRILALVKQVGLIKEFQSVVVGFTDTLTFLKKHMNQRRTDKKSFAQSALAEDFLGSAFMKEAAHDASADVSVLQQLLTHKDINVSLKDLMNAGVTVNYAMNSKVWKDSLSALRADKTVKTDKQCGVSVNIITKIAKAGITMNHLRKTYEANGLEGLQILLSQSINQKPRVTAREQTIAAIKSKLDELINSNVQ